MLYQLIWLFFCYSFLGWLLEISANAIRYHRYQDRGVLSSPLCLIYGVTGCLVTVMLRELSGQWFFLFLGSAIYATLVEWAAGHILERLTLSRWWDYSNRRFNLDGYICLEASVVWGLLGVVCVKWLAPLLLALYGLMPALLGHIIVWALVVLLALDGTGTALTIGGVRHKFPPLEAVHNRLAGATLRLGMWILSRWERRMNRANPDAAFQRPKREKSAVFAAGCSFYKIMLLYVLGSFLGDVAETLFCRLTMGEWMSRSSLVWGPFSIVWGMALALVTLFLYRYRGKSSSWLFCVGTLLGGAYEYLCSVGTEIFFGAVFWDYSKLPFNLGGRINLLYCFFWGFATVIWFKLLLPPVERVIEKLPMRFGKILTWILIVFMAVDMLVSAAALIRYDARSKGVPATTSLEAVLDERFDDALMMRVYPKLKHVS